MRRVPVMSWDFSISINELRSCLNGLWWVIEYRNESSPYCCWGHHVKNAENRDTLLDCLISPHPSSSPPPFSNMHAKSIGAVHHDLRHANISAVILESFCHDFRGASIFERVKRWRRWISLMRVHIHIFFLYGTPYLRKKLSSNQKQ